MAPAADTPALEGWFGLADAVFYDPVMFKSVMFCPTFNASMPPAEAGGCLGAPDRPVGIWFDKFSDGRGFTLARHLREAAHHTGLLVADGQLIPDQADYLWRCGFSHVRILVDHASQWRRSLELAPPPMQQVLATGRQRQHRCPAGRG